MTFIQLAAGFPSHPVALARLVVLVLFPAVELALASRFRAPSGLAVRFAFQASFHLRSLRPTMAEAPYRYVIGTGKTVFISGPSSAGLRRWM
jgi:hypothetical protein